MITELSTRECCQQDMAFIRPEFRTVRTVANAVAGVITTARCKCVGTAQPSHSLECRCGYIRRAGTAWRERVHTVFGLQAHETEPKAGHSSLGNSSYSTSTQVLASCHTRALSMIFPGQNCVARHCQTERPNDQSGWKRHLELSPSNFVALMAELCHAPAHTYSALLVSQ
jgi:hypothetical protein